MYRKFKWNILVLEKNLIAIYKNSAVIVKLVWNGFKYFLYTMKWEGASGIWFGLFTLCWPHGRVMERHSNALESDQSRTGQAASRTALDWWSVIMGKREEASGEQVLNLKICKHKQKIPVTFGSIRDPHRTHSKLQRSQSLKTKQAPVRWKNRAGCLVLTAAPVTGTVLRDCSLIWKSPNNHLRIQRLLNKQADVQCSVNGYSEYLLLFFDKSTATILE